MKTKNLRPLLFFILILTAVFAPPTVAAERTIPRVLDLDVQTLAGTDDGTGIAPIQVIWTMRFDGPLRDGDIEGVVIVANEVSLGPVIRTGGRWSYPDAKTLRLEIPLGALLDFVGGFEDGSQRLRFQVGVTLKGRPQAVSKLVYDFLENREVPTDEVTPATAEAATPRTVLETKTTAAVDSGSDSPVAAVKRFIGAQARGDSEGMLSETAIERLTASERAAVKAAIQRVAEKVKLSDMEFAAIATGIGKRGEMALVRFTLSCTVRAGGVSVPQAGGNMALLLREGAAWKVHNIVADLPLTLSIYERAPVNAFTAAETATGAMAGNDSPTLEAMRFAVLVNDGMAARISTVQYSAPSATPQVLGTPAKVQGLIDLEQVNREINQAIDEWRVDEGKLFRDSVYSAWGQVPIMGDAISNGYTVYERAKTLALELPESVRAGNVEAALLDLGLVAWGGVQIVTEIIPGLDTATDLVEGSLDQWRYNAVQRFNYLKIMKMIEQADFRSLRKYLILRFTQQNVEARKPRDLGGSRYADWHGISPALKSLEFLSDKFLRTDSRVIFEVGAELEVRKSDNETIFSVAEKIGARIKGSLDDAVAYIPLRLKKLAAFDASVGDAILQDFSIREDGRFIVYRLTCTRGKQRISVRLTDGTRTQPLDIENLVFNAVEGVQWLTADAKPASTISVKVSETLNGVRLTPRMAPASAGRVTPPELVGLPCLSMSMDESQLATVATFGEWPTAAMAITGNDAGETMLRVGFPKGNDVREMNATLPIHVEGKPKAAGCKPLRLCDFDGFYSSISRSSCENCAQNGQFCEACEKYKRAVDTCSGGGEWITDERALLGVRLSFEDLRKQYLEPGQRSVNFNYFESRDTTECFELKRGGN
ncbi:MAG: nuclear transport factor 2 family protein [Gammaproteobacteria bacterium]|nr:nuclear transport factor 2 family protein [Gammaproteobacteria bacterium]